MNHTIKPLMHRLTHRELEIFLLIGQGLSSGQIAQQLSLSNRAIRTYQDRIREKLHLDPAGDELPRQAVHWLRTCTDECAGED